MIGELTPRQQDAVDELAERYHLVMVDEGIDGSVILTPACFCERCGGDGIDPDSYDNRDAFDDCSGCGGTGGVPTVLTPLVVGANGPEEAGK